MLKICETCPNRTPECYSGSLEVGEGFVFVDPDGHYEWGAVEDHSEEDGILFGFQNGTVNDLDGTTFPALTESINGCSAPAIEYGEKQAPGWRGLILRETVTVIIKSTCPAFEEHLDVTAAADIIDYFGIPPLPEI